MSESTASLKALITSDSSKFTQGFDAASQKLQGFRDKIKDLKITTDKYKLEVIKNNQRLNEFKEKISDVRAKLEAKLITEKKATALTQKYENSIQQAALKNEQLKHNIDKVNRRISTYKNKLRSAVAQNLKAKNSNNALEKSFGGLKLAMLAVVGVFLVLIRNTIMYISKTIGVFTVQEKALDRLAISMMNQGIYSEELFKKYQKMASALQRVTKYGDEVTLSGMALIQSYIGGIEITKDFTESIQDFATAHKLDLKTAFNLTGKSIGSSTNALSRYGIVLGKNMSKVEKMKSIQEQSNRLFRGFARSTASGTGQYEQIKNIWSDIEEKIGNIFTFGLGPVTSALKRVLILTNDILDKEGVVKYFADLVRISLQIIADILNFIADILEVFKKKNDKLLKSLTRMVELIDELWKKLKEVVSTVWSLFANVFERITGIKLELNSIIEIIINIANAAIEATNKVLESVTDVVNKISIGYHMLELIAAKDTGTKLGDLLNIYDTLYMQKFPKLDHKDYAKTIANNTGETSKTTKEIKNKFSQTQRNFFQAIERAWKNRDKLSGLLSPQQRYNQAYSNNIGSQSNRPKQVSNFKVVINGKEMGQLPLTGELTPLTIRQIVEFFRNLGYIIAPNPQVNIIPA